MKKFCISFFFVLVAVVAVAQTPAQLKFLGIPVDGRKSDFITALKAKVFVYDAEQDVLVGNVNGVESEVSISEKDGEICSVAVEDLNPYDEAQVRIRFNNLLKQFQNSEEYVEDEDNDSLKEGEDISYEMKMHDKTYQASFWVNPFYGWTEEEFEEWSNLHGSHLEFQYQVSICIDEQDGKYYIMLNYDNLINSPIDSITF